MNDRDRLEAFLEHAFNGADRPTLEAYLADDIEINEAPSLPYGGTHRGKAAYFKLVAEVFAQWENTRINVLEYIGENTTIVVLATLTGTNRRDGRSVEMPIAEVWRFENELISRITPFYYDTAQLIA